MECPHKTRKSNVCVCVALTSGGTLTDHSQTIWWILHSKYAFSKCQTPVWLANIIQFPEVKVQDFISLPCFKLLNCYTGFAKVCKIMPKSFNLSNIFSWAMCHPEFNWECLLYCNYMSSIWIWIWDRKPDLEVWNLNVRKRKLNWNSKK